MTNQEANLNKIADLHEDLYELSLERTAFDEVTFKKYCEVISKKIEVLHLDLI